MKKSKKVKILLAIAVRSVDSGALCSELRSKKIADCIGDRCAIVQIRSCDRWRSVCRHVGACGGPVCFASQQIELAYYPGPWNRKKMTEPIVAVIAAQEAAIVPDRLQTDRQTDRQAGRQTGRQTNRQTETDRQKENIGKCNVIHHRTSKISKNNKTSKSNLLKCNYRSLIRSRSPIDDRKISRSPIARSVPIVRSGATKLILCKRGRLEPPT